MIVRKGSGWENFDFWAEKLVRREASFSVFAANTRSEFARLARAVMRRRRPPAWLGIDDVVNSLVGYAWHYALERVSRDGSVGYVVGRYVGGPGAYLRRKLRQKMGKDLSKARGEDQNRRAGPPAPEYLSKTGVHGGAGGLPEIPVASTSEIVLERSRRIARMMSWCETPKERVVLRAIVTGGSEPLVIEALAADPEAPSIGVTNRDEAKLAVQAFMKDWSAQFGAPKASTRVRREAA